jgi:hypothetical protein
MSGTYEKGESSSSSREGESEEESKFSPTPTYEVNSSIMNESHDAIQKPSKSVTKPYFVLLILFPFQIWLTFS